MDCPIIMEELLEVIRTLRSEQGCPWDREQTHESLKRNLLEETGEVLEAIDEQDPEGLCEELGDVLLQVVMHARIAEEEGTFTFDDVVSGLTRKLVRRHPHVFGNVAVNDTAEVLENWEAIKRQEKPGASSAVGRIPRYLPALERAYKIQKHVSRVGFDWDAVDDVLAKVDEELGEIREALRDGRPARIRDELGDLLFSVVNLGRFVGHRPEEALDDTIQKFVRRFQDVEAQVAASGRTLEDCSLEEMEACWVRAKQQEVP
jgi:tetrapyrrole methylase family protein/MazG family protein